MGQDETDGSEDRVKNNTSPTQQVVQISLLLLDAVFGPPGVNFPGGIKILGC